MHDRVAALAANGSVPTTAGVVAAKEEPEPGDSMSPADSIILATAADFESIDRGIERPLLAVDHPRVPSNPVGRYGPQDKNHLRQGGGLGNAQP
jgi:hypothetical protein